MLRHRLLHPRLSATLILAASASCGMGQSANTAPHNWKKIADLPPGTPLLVQERGPHPLTSCLLEWIDNNALACKTFDELGHTTRVVFPAANVRSVAHDEALDDGPHTDKAIYVGMVVGGLIGGALAGGDGVKAGFIGAAFGAAAGGGMAVATSDRVDAHPRPMWSMQLRRPARRFWRP